jgi:hypothetical protein
MMKCKHNYRTWQQSQQHRNRGDLRVDVRRELRSGKHRLGGELMAVEDLRKDCIVVRSEVKKCFRGTL